MSRAKHEKWYGFIEEVGEDSWWGRVYIDGEPYQAEFTEPIPPTQRPGSYFTIHRTKRGHVYFYWHPGAHVSRRQFKKIRRRGRELHRWLTAGDTGQRLREMDSNHHNEGQSLASCR